MMWFGKDKDHDRKDFDPKTPAQNDRLICDPDATSRLQRVWDQLPRDNGVPRRAALNPIDLGPMIADCFVADRIAPGLARLRVAGRNLSRYCGVEPRGMPLSVLFDAGSRADLSAAIAVCFDEPALVEVPVVAEEGIGRPALSGQVILLPMRDEAGLVTKALGGLFLSGRIGRGPRRFRIDGSLPKRKMPLAAAAAMAERRSEGRAALHLVVDNSR